MKAIVMERFGPPADVLECRDVPAPSPGPGRVLVRMLASPINPSDVLTVEGNYCFRPPLPYSPGFEGVGVVESGGGLLGRLRRGKRVAVINDKGGNWAEYVTVSAKHVVPVPADMPDELAASFFVNPATALVMTCYVLKVPAGERLLQTAAASALGKMVVRLSKRYGFRTVNVVRRPEQAEELKRLGADDVVVADGPAVEEAVLKATGGEPVRYAIEPVGGATGTAAAQCLARGGRMLVYGLLSGEPITVNPRFLIAGSRTVEGFWLADWSRGQGIPTMLSLFRRVRAMIREGLLATEFVGTYPLERIGEAARHVTTPGRGGKVLLRIAGG
jgi:NADPH:quinone reductase-like Zn-dependent oxidoreductase